MGINRELLKLATWQLEKQGIVPPGGPMGGDPAMGGAPPMGGPPMGGPPMGGPPMGDPAMGGAPPPMEPPMDAPPPPPTDDVRSIIQEELANAGMGGNGAAVGPAGAKAKKFDPEELNTKLYNMEKLIVAISNAMGVSLPPEALLGPPPEGTTAPEGAAGPEEPPVDLAGPGSSIKPIEPIQPAMPMGPEGGAAPPMGDGGMGGGGEMLKVSEHLPQVPTVGSPFTGSTGEARVGPSAADLFNKTAALAQMARNANSRGQ